MSENEAGKWVVVVALMLGLFVSGGLLGSAFKAEEMHRAAVKSNAGRWVVDEKTGQTSWEWTGRGE